MQDSQTIQLRSLRYPFAPSIHPEGASVERQANARWADKLGAPPPPDVVCRLERTRVPHLAARCFPRAARGDLDLVVDYLFWLFLWDDQIDRPIDGKLPAVEWLREQVAQASAVLEGAPPERASPLLVRELARLHSALAARMSPAWMKRFEAHLRAYFAATLEELAIRHAHVILDVSAYVRLRQQVVGAYASLDLIELGHRAPLSPAVWSDATFWEMVTAAVNVIAWDNDLLSLRAEIHEGSRLNLVWSLQAERRSTPQDALESAVAMRNDEVLRLLELERSRPSFGDEEPAVQRFIEGLHEWIRGSHDWSIECARYHGDAAS